MEALKKELAKQIKEAHREARKAKDDFIFEVLMERAHAYNNILNIIEASEKEK